MTDLTTPAHKPHTVSQFVGTEGSRLPRLTSNTIGSSAKPAKVRGGTSLYSDIDALLIKLGSTLLDMGLLPYRTQKCIQEVREWILDVSSDPRFGTDEDDFIENRFIRYLVGHETPDGFRVELAKWDRIESLLITEEGAQPHMIVNLHKFVGVEIGRLLKQTGRLPRTAANKD